MKERKETPTPTFPEIPDEEKVYAGESTGRTGYPAGHKVRGHDVAELRKRFHGKETEGEGESKETELETAPEEAPPE